MRKISTIIFILFCINLLRSQTFSPPGAEWHYRRYDYNSYTNGVLELKYSGDQLINNVNCKKIVGTYTGTTMSQPNPTVTSAGGTYYFYQNNQTVFLYNSYKNVFDTVVNFNAGIGDKWLLTNRLSSNCDSNITRGPSTVFDTGHVIINGFFLKKISIAFNYINYSYAQSTNYSKTYSLTLIERIMDPSQFLFPYNCDFFDGPPPGNFMCYKDDAFPLYMSPSYTTCFHTTTSINENWLKNKTIELFPQPSIDEFFIEYNTNDENRIILTLFNCFGKLIREEEITFSNNLASVKVDALPNGIYMVNLKDDKIGNIYKRLVISR